MFQSSSLAGRIGTPLRPALMPSMSTTSTPAPRSSQIVPGTFPAWKLASVSAPKATNSPWGIKITRVTANTSTSASAIRA